MKKVRSPFKIQGNKFELLDQIEDARLRIKNKHSVWVEPFMGSATVGLNMANGPAFFYDTNPHTVKFFNGLIGGKLPIDRIQRKLGRCHKSMIKEGDGFYYKLRERFNKSHCPIDFFALNHLSHSGLIRFNLSGGFNTPHGKNKVLPLSLISSLMKRCEHVRDAGQAHGWTFKKMDFRKAIPLHAENKDAVLFLDPPYIERNPTYFSSWSMDEEEALFNSLDGIKASFLLTTWIQNGDSTHKNPSIEPLWSKYPYISRMHRYFVRGQAKNVTIEEAVFYKR